MNNHCSIDLLRAALAEDLPTEDEACLHQHLQHCDECTAALERLAGGTRWCDEVASQLSDDGLDAAECRPVCVDVAIGVVM